MRPAVGSVVGLVIYYLVRRQESTAVESASSP